MAWILNQMKFIFMVKDMKKIETLTKEQEDYLPLFRKEYLDAAISGKRADRAKLESAISDAYATIGKKSPIVIILQSPLQAMMAIKFMKSFANKETWGQLGDQLWDQLVDQLMDQLRDQLMDQLWGQLVDQLGDQLGGQLWGHLVDQLGDQLRGHNIYDGDYLWGSHDLFWVAFYKFGELIGVKYTKEQSAKLDIMKRIGFECEWWWPYEGICFVSERPIETNWDDRGLLHGENKPAVLYQDGYSMFMWHGTRVPEDWIKDKSSLTPKVAITWNNIEQRRAACEILGWAKILKELNAKTIQKDEDPQIGELLEVDIPDIGREKFLRVLCGTGREFAMPVPPEMTSALQANAWTYGLEPSEYNPEIRT